MPSGALEGSGSELGTVGANLPAGSKVRAPGESAIARVLGGLRMRKMRIPRTQRRTTNPAIRVAELGLGEVGGKDDFFPVFLLIHFHLHPGTERVGSEMLVNAIRPEAARLTGHEK